MVQGQEDEKLVSRIRQGDEAAFEELVSKYRGYIFTVVKNHVPYNDVEEVVHTTFIAAYKSLPTYSARGALKVWLAKIAIHRSMDYWRKKNRRKEVVISSLTENQNEWAETVLAGNAVESFSAEERQAAASDVLRWALEQLSPKDRTLITLVHLQGHSIKEAAELLGWSGVNVRVRAHRAKKQLKSVLLSLQQREDEEL